MQLVEPRTHARRHVDTCPQRPLSNFPPSASSLSGAPITHSGWRWFFSGSEGRQHQALGGGPPHNPQSCYSTPSQPPSPRGVGGPALHSRSRTPVTILHPLPHSCLSVSLISSTPSSSWISSPFVVYYSSRRLSSRPTLVLPPLLRSSRGSVHTTTLCLSRPSPRWCTLAAARWSMLPLPYPAVYYIKPPWGRVIRQEHLKTKPCPASGLPIFEAKLIRHEHRGIKKSALWVTFSGAPPVI